MGVNFLEGMEELIEGVEKVNSQTSRWPIALESKEGGRKRQTPWGTAIQ